jgi:hypothetical protein
MSVNVEWDDSEQRILRYTYEAGWTWEEYAAAVAEATRLVVKVDGQIDVIGDFSKSTLLPERALSNFRKSLATSPDTVPFKMVVLIIRNEFIARMLDTFSRMYPSARGKIRSAPSLEDARRIIRADRATRR